MSRLLVDDFDHALRLRGSPRRDAFKHAHKAMLGHGFYATDVDLVLVEKRPPGVVAIVDCKQPGEPVSFAEVLAYTALLSVAPVYLVEVDDPLTGPFAIRRYRTGDWEPRPPEVALEPVAVCADWAAFRRWERALRRTYAGWPTEVVP
jgi:hypothetical protein